jgi:Holliday junction DNA helicase RuvA
MIERLTGTVAAKSPDSVVVDVGGVGFLVEVSATTLREVPPVGAQVVLLAHMHVREDALQLFAFSTEDERALFRLLLGVSKIGPKLALAALSCRRPAELRKAIASGDVALLSSVPGIGKKTAERMVMELREKVGELVTSGFGVPGMVEFEESGSLGLARAALIELGYAPQEAERLLVSVDSEQPVEHIIRQALVRRS